MGTWIVGIVIFIIAALAGYSVYKDRKRGKGCGCCDDCEVCGDTAAKKRRNSKFS